MKFRSAILLILLTSLTSCSSITDELIGIAKAGAWGPMELRSGSAEDQFFFIAEDSPDTKIKADVIQKKNQLLVYPAEALISGKIYKLVAEGRSKPVVKNIKIRKTCILYLARSDESSALWKNCPDVEPVRITNLDEIIEEFSVSRSGELIVYTITNDQGGNEIWQVRPDGSRRKIVFDCGESTCSNLVLDSFTRRLVFKQQNKTQQIGVLDLETGNISYINRSGSEVSLSPDGKFLSLLDNGSGKLTFINLANRNQMTVQSGNGLVGEWARDSHSILYGEMEFWGGIPGVKVNELEISSGEIKTILDDPGQSLEFYQPRHTRDEGIFLALVRQRNSGASSQLWLLGEGALVIKQITTDPLFHYSFPSWSPDYSELVFQRFQINKSDGHAQIVVWNQDLDSFQIIAENGSSPVWVP